MAQSKGKSTPRRPTKAATRKKRGRKKGAATIAGEENATRLADNKHIQAAIDHSILELDLSRLVQIINDPDLEAKVTRATRGANTEDVLASLNEKLQRYGKAYAESARSLEDRFAEDTFEPGAFLRSTQRNAVNADLRRELLATTNTKNLKEVLVALEERFQFCKEMYTSGSRAAQNSSVKKAKKGGRKPSSAGAKSSDGTGDDLFEIIATIGSIIGLIYEYYYSCYDTNVIRCQHINEYQYGCWGITDKSRLGPDGLGRVCCGYDYWKTPIVEFDAGIGDPANWWDIDCEPAWLGGMREIYFELPPAPCDGFLQWEVYLRPQIYYFTNNTPTPAAIFISACPLVHQDIEQAMPALPPFVWPSPATSGNLLTYCGESIGAMKGNPQLRSGSFEVANGQVSRIHFVCYTYMSAMGGVVKGESAIDFYDPRGENPDNFNPREDAPNSPYGLRYEFSIG